MKPEEDRYDELMKILRKSQPKLENTKDIENEVINRIRLMSRKEERPMGLFDYLFGWVYIGWIRKSLLAASVFMVVFFIYQQSVILKRLNALSNQPVVSGSRIMTGSRSTINGKMFLYMFSGRKIRTDRNTVTEKQIDEFLKSLDDLQDKYKDLIRLIDENPELKKEIEKRMSDNHRKKINL